MRYLLIMRDISGRGYKAVHDFNTSVERDAFVMHRLMEEDYETDYIEECIDSLNRGSVITEEGCEYEYV